MITAAGPTGADGVTPAGRCVQCTGEVEEITAQAVDKRIHHPTGWVTVRGVLYQLVPCGCTYGWEPESVALIVEVVPPPGRHRAPATRPPLLRLLDVGRWNKQARRAGRLLD